MTDYRKGRPEFYDLRLYLGRHFNAPLHTSLSRGVDGIVGSPLTTRLLSRLYGPMNSTLYYDPGSDGGCRGMDLSAVRRRKRDLVIAFPMRSHTNASLYL